MAFDPKEFRVMHRLDLSGNLVRVILEDGTSLSVVVWRGYLVRAARQIDVEDFASGPKVIDGLVSGFLSVQGEFANDVTAIEPVDDAVRLACRVLHGDCQDALALAELIVARGKEAEKL